ncbi:MAG: hypothetical protein KDC49_20905 [Saprospiraceae bacterium]|nr:hypothetical protein [Saprospiraceae bacterium]
MNKCAHFLLACFICIGTTFPLIAQEQIHTKLGNTLSLNDNGTYVLQTVAKNTASNSPFEQPKPYLELDQAYRTKMSQLETYCLSRDTSMSIALHRYQTELNKLRNQKTGLPDQNGLTATLNAKIAELERQVELTNASYERLMPLCQEVKAFRIIDSEKKLTSSIDRLHQEHFGNSAGKEEVVVQKTFKTPQIDQRKPWEIEITNSSEELPSLLTYTPDRLKNYYKDNYLLEVFPKLINKNYLELKFVFHSKDVAKSYGTINKGAMLKIDFIHGQSIVLKASKSIDPSLEEYTGNTIYNAIYRIKTKDEYKKLKSTSLDNIGVMWTSGFELYPVYNIDYFRQAN